MPRRPQSVPVPLVRAAAVLATVLAGQAGVTGTASANPPCVGIVVVVDRGPLPAALPGATAGALPATPGQPPPRGTVACAESRTGDAETGLDVLARAGVQVEGTARWGAAFVCRVDGRPGADEPVQLPDGSTVRESCAQTPSTQAYWSLWTAQTGGAWEYSSVGASELELQDGDALGLTFTVGESTGPALTPDAARSGDHGDEWTAPATDPDGSGAPDALGTHPATGDTGARGDGEPGSRALVLAALGLVALIGVVAALRLRRAP